MPKTPKSRRRITPTEIGFGDSPLAVHLIDWDFFFDFYLNPYWNKIISGVTDTKGFKEVSKDLRASNRYSFGKLVSFLIFTSDSAKKRGVSKRLVWADFSDYCDSCLTQIRADMRPAAAAASAEQCSSTSDAVAADAIGRCSSTSDVADGCGDDAISPDCSRSFCQKDVVCQPDLSKH